MEFGSLDLFDNDHEEEEVKKEDLALKARLCYVPRLCSTDPWDNRLPQDDENGKKHNVGDNVLHNILEKFKAKSMVSRLDLPGTWPGAVGPPCERSLQNIRINEWLS